MVGDLNRNHLNREEKLHLMVLMISRADEDKGAGYKLITLPEDDYRLESGDEILFCSREGVRNEISWVLNNSNALYYVQTGEQESDSWIWRFFSGRQSIVDSDEV